MFKIVYRVCPNCGPGRPVKCNANNPAKSMANHQNRMKCYVTIQDVPEVNMTSSISQVVSGNFPAVHEPGSMTNLNVDPGAMGTIHLLKTYRRGNFQDIQANCQIFCAMDIPGELLIASNNEKQSLR